jgi:hypothetical protein
MFCGAGTVNVDKTVNIPKLAGELFLFTGYKFMVDGSTSTAQGYIVVYSSNVNVSSSAHVGVYESLVAGIPQITTATFSAALISSITVKISEHVP